MFNVKWWQERLYSDPLSQDAVLSFISTISNFIQPSHEVLDVGAGAGHLNTYNFKGKVRRMIGVDFDPRVKENPLLDEGIQCGADALPFPNDSFDIIFSIYVMEHVDDPASFASQIFRVLRPGGYYLALTPNRFHYVPLIAAVTPTSFHKWLNKRRGREEGDTFPTYYRLNSKGVQKSVFREAGFEVKQISSIEIQPNYLKFCTPAFLMGAAYERIVNSSELLEYLRVNLITIVRKPD